MPPIRRARKHVHRSPIDSIPRRFQPPRAASQPALLRAVKGLPQPVHYPILPALSPSPVSPDSASSAPSSTDDQTIRSLPIEAGLPVKGKMAPMRKGIAEDGGMGAEIAPMRQKRRLESGPEEAGEAAIHNRFYEGEFSAWTLTSRTKMRNQLVKRAGGANKASEARKQGDRVLRGRRTGVTKNKKVPQKLGKFGLPKGQGNLGLDDADTPYRTISSAGGSIDVRMKDPSLASGDVSMRDAVGSSPEVGFASNKAGTVKVDASMGGPVGGSPVVNGGINRAGKEQEVNAIDLVRTLGRHLAIFVAAAQDSTNGLRDNAEYRAWRDFLGRL